MHKTVKLISGIAFMFHRFWSRISQQVKFDMKLFHNGGYAQIETHAWQSQKMLGFLAIPFKGPVKHQAMLS